MMLVDDVERTRASGTFTCVCTVTAGGHAPRAGGSTPNAYN
jgi:hypothetical protein